MQITSLTSARPALRACSAPAAAEAPPEDGFSARGAWWQPPLRPVAPGVPTRSEAPPQLGEQRTFWTWDMSVMPPAAKQVTATCRADGATGYIFVDNAVWGSKVKEEDVKILSERFEQRSPSGSVDPRRGVAAIDHDWFGTPPLGLDGDPKVYLLVTEMAQYMGTTLDGYFNPFDTITDAQAQEQGQRSNEKEIIYLNAAGGGPIAGDYMQGVLAHEYQHLLHQPHDAEEESWLSETLAEIAMKVNGYHTDMGHVVRHQAKPEKPLVSKMYVDYGACMLFGTYLTEQYGKSFVQELSRDPLHGTASLDATLERFGRTERFPDLYKDWAVANFADSRGVAAPGLHYGSLDLPAPAELGLAAGTPLETTLAPSGVRYVRLPAGDAASLKLESDQPGITLELLSFAGRKMERIPLDPANACQLPAGSDRVLVVGSLAPDKAKLKLELAPAAV